MEGNCLRQVALLIVDMQNDFVRRGAPLEVPDARKHDRGAPCAAPGFPSPRMAGCVHEVSQPTGTGTALANILNSR